jgi:hypothetical protein
VRFVPGVVVHQEDVVVHRAPGACLPNLLFDGLAPDGNRPPPAVPRNSMSLSPWMARRGRRTLRSPCHPSRKPATPSTLAETALSKGWPGAD